MPTLSQSGSVPKTRSAPISLAFSIAMVSASFSSGLGERTVEKLPSGSSCSLTTVTSIPSSIFLTGILPVP